MAVAWYSWGSLQGLLLAANNRLGNRPLTLEAVPKATRDGELYRDAKRDMSSRATERET